jgi:DnaJ-class molecular chaperone
MSRQKFHQKYHDCSFCHGSGELHEFPCPHCGGTGRVSGLQETEAEQMDFGSTTHD